MKSIKDLVNTNVDTPKLSNEEFLKRDSDYYNQQVGNLTEYDCPICKNKGNMLKVVFDDYYKDYIQKMVVCECMKKRETIKRAKDSGLGEYIYKKFDDYIAEKDWQKAIKQKAIDYLKADDDKWFVILGQSGAGKTLICSIISRHLLANRNVIYITWTDFISQLKRDMMGDNSNEVTSYLENIKKTDVLFIDELLKKYNETDLKYIIEIINYRYTNRLKTIITSEKVLEELLEIDEATFSRVVEMSDKYITNIKKDTSKNYRLRNIL